MDKGTNTACGTDDAADVRRYCSAIFRGGDASRVRANVGLEEVEREADEVGCANEQEPTGSRATRITKQCAKVVNGCRHAAKTYET